MENLQQIITQEVSAVLNPGFNTSKAKVDSIVDKYLGNIKDGSDNTYIQKLDNFVSAVYTGALDAVKKSTSLKELAHVASWFYRLFNDQTYKACLNIFGSGNVWTLAAMSVVKDAQTIYKPCLDHIETLRNENAPKIQEVVKEKLKEFLIKDPNFTGSLQNIKEHWKDFFEKDKVLATQYDSIEEAVEEQSRYDLNSDLHVIFSAFSSSAGKDIYGNSMLVPKKSVAPRFTIFGREIGQKMVTEKGTPELEELIKRIEQK